MDDDAWFATLATLDDHDDAFFSALLWADSPHSSDGNAAESTTSALCGFGSIDDKDENPHGDNGVHPPPGPPSRRVPMDQRGAARPVKKRKRTAHRPKEEIARLRRSVADLEAMLAVHTDRSAAPTRRPNVDAMTSMTSPACIMWKNVAARQFQRRLDAERENQALRSRVKQQLAVVKSLARLVQRAQHGLPSEDVPRSMIPIDLQVFASKRQELQTAVAMVFHAPNSIHTFQLRDEEFRTTHKLTMPSDLNIQAGTLLAQSCEKRFVPAACAGLGDVLWAGGEISDSKHALYQVRELECFDGNFFVSFSFEFPTMFGYARFNGVRARARVRDGSRDAIAIVASVWPDAASPAEVQGSSFDLRASTVTQPHRRFASMSEVLVNVECTRLVLPTGSAQMTQRQAWTLDAMVSRTHKFLLDQNNQYIDRIVLQEADTQTWVCRDQAQVHMIEARDLKAKTCVDGFHGYVLTSCANQVASKKTSTKYETLG